MRSRCGRADLVRAFASGQPDLLVSTAELLGFQKEEPAPLLKEKATPLKPAPDPEPDPDDQVDDLEPLPFWRLEEHVALAPIIVNQPIEPEQEDVEKSDAALKFSELQPLASWRVLGPRLRQRAAIPVDGRSLDVRQIVRRLSCGDRLNRLPRKQRLSWGQSLHIIRDRSLRLVPYWRDQDLVQRWLQRLVPGGAVRTADFFDGLDHPVFEDGSDYEMTAPGTLVVMLGDLGCLAREGLGLKRYWASFARRLADAESRAVALSPASPALWPDDLKRAWRMISWDALSAWNGKGEQERARQTERLLTLISPAIRIEPDLLRAIRCLLEPKDADAGTEADVWQHPALIGRSSEAGTLDPDKSNHFREQFAKQPEALRKQVLDLIQARHTELPREIWDEELFSLDPASQVLDGIGEQLPAAQARLRRIEAEATAGAANIAGVDTLGWFRRVERRVPDRVWRDPAVQGPLSRLWYAAHRDEDDPKPPPGFVPGEIPSKTEDELREFSVIQQGNRIRFLRQPSTVPSIIPGLGLLGRLSSWNRLVQIQTLSFWKDDQPPSWAASWGTDAVGSWVTFEVETEDGETVSQRMRWIPAGTFLMGSPESEPEREEDEGPQHEVTISQGFWMFDTACSQMLWQAIMGKNPSHFEGPLRPVDTVSFDDVQRFIERINKRAPGLCLDLPSEAMWEYACRAGTTTAFSFGDDITTDQMNYDGNYPYAETSKGRYRKETVPVGSLPANGWGLFEMHGNVDEWCRDSLRDYSPDPVVDPLGPLDGAGRVLRGGSWSSDAQYLRSARRDAYQPGLRNGGIGFRCARVQAGAEPAGGGQGGERSRLPDSRRPGGGQLVQFEAGTGQGQGEIPEKVAGFIIETDAERLTFKQFHQPDWAHDIGRDQYGLWTSIAVPTDGGDPVTQRMRWIEPGAFLMGSPEGEPGRQDSEGPQHEVTIGKGFWLFDTPCTQAFWQAVMVKNPSHFQSPDRPVEQVSFDEVQDFLARLEERVPGLGLALPSEAQWEYACRADSQTAIYTGDLAILGQRHAPALDPIAWYGGNSGVDFDLDNGYDSSGWPEKQYDHKKAGTRPVGKKQPNSWGLYDMQGNVWEWCEDHYHDGYDGAPDDGSAWLSEDGSKRVLRGGSWLNDAQLLRSARRIAFLPDGRYDDIGFRCARVQA